jgi:hypothetical protein
MPYAVDTSVPVERSKSQIEALLTKHGAEGYHTGWQAPTPNDPGWDAVEFAWKGKVIRFRISRPTAKQLASRRRSGRDIQRALEQQSRSRWRVLFLVIKAKLEAVEAGVSVFEEEFMSFIVTASGRTVGEILLPRLSSGSQLQLEAVAE